MIGAFLLPTSNFADLMDRCRRQSCRLLVVDESDQQAKQVRVKVLGHRGDYPVEDPVVLPFKAIVIVDNGTGDCGETNFADTDCRGHASRSVNAAKCVINPP